MWDRVESTPPTPILVPPLLGWTVREIDVVRKSVQWTAFYAANRNCLLMYEPAGGATTKKIKIPSLLHLPHIIDNFIMVQSRTYSEVFI